VTRRVELSSRLRAAIAAAAHEAYPAECCGLLEGMRVHEGWRVMALHPTANLSGHNHAFQIDPIVHIAAQKTARAKGHAIVGCYHSHPDGQAHPSGVDLAGASEENFLWLIAAGGTVRAFVYLRGVFTGADCVTSSE
jgi:proteasome lid subunit RPN8/RPN11